MRGRRRIEHHVDRERDHRARPFLRRAEQQIHRHREPVVDLHLVADGEVELVEDHRLRDVRGELGMALHHRHRARAPALVGGREFGRAAEREGRHDLDRERRRVVVVDDDGDVGLRLLHPFLRFLEAREHPLPVRLLGLLVVDRRADRRHVRRRHSCDDPSHVSTSPCCVFSISICSASPCRLRLARFRFGAPDQHARRLAAGLAAVAFDRAAAGEHHRGVVVLRGAGHHRGEMPERMAVGRAELGGEIDVAAELEHAVVVALEDGFGLLRRQVELLEVLRLVRLEGLAVLVLHQRHAEHVDAEALARALRVEHEGAGDVVVFLLLASGVLARHRLSSIHAKSAGLP